MGRPDPPTFFFLHIMKTAGTSFSQQIRDNFPPEQIWPRPDSPRRQAEYWHLDDLRALPEEERAGVRAFHGHFPSLAADLVGADVTITLLRHPVERTVSHLRHCARHFEQHRGKSLEEIYEDPWHHPLFFRNYQVKQFAMTEADAPKAHNQVIDVDEARLARAITELERIDVLGLTDRFDELLDEVGERFGWALTRGLRYETSPRRLGAPRALRDRILADSAADVAFYDHARSQYERRRAGR